MLAAAGLDRMLCHWHKSYNVYMQTVQEKQELESSRVESVALVRPENESRKHSCTLGEFELALRF